MVVEEMAKFSTCCEGRGFANGFYTEYKRKKNEMIPRLLVLSPGKLELLLTEKRNKVRVGTKIWREKSRNFFW